MLQPEAAHPDRDVPSTDYVAAGVMTAPSYLGWALKFEELESRTFEAQSLRLEIEELRAENEELRAENEG